MDYCHLSLFEVGEMALNEYLYFMREAFIYQMYQTEGGTEYLDNAWRISQTEPDREAIRKNFKNRKERMNGSE